MIRKISAAGTVIAALLVAATANAQSNPLGHWASQYGISAGKLTAGTTGDKMDFKPYSASYLPRYEGPLNRQHDSAIDDHILHGYPNPDGSNCDLIHDNIKKNVDKSSAGKFDAAVTNAEGSNPNLSDAYEKEGHDANAPSWTGFCHLWSPAGLDPVSNFIISMDRVYADVPFGIGDMKELNTWNYPHPNALFFGDRNYGDEKPDNNFDPTDLLAILQNYIGHDKPGVVMDVTPGDEVWNQPFYSWSNEAKDGTADDAKAAGLTVPEGGKVLNATLTMTWSVEGSYAYRGDAYTRDRSLTYTAVTDKDGNVVGAKWTNGAISEVPDFAWVPNSKWETANYKRLLKIAKEGIPLAGVEKLCADLASLPNGSVPADIAADIRKQLDSVCPLLDSNKLDAYIKDIAAKKGIDYSVLDAAINGGQPQG